MAVLLLTGLALVAVMAAGLLLISSAQASKRQRMARRLAGGAEGHRADGRREWFMRLAERGQRFDQLIEDPEETTILLAQAGWRGPRARALFYAFQLVLPLLLVLMLAPFWFALSAGLGLLGGGIVVVFLLLLAAVFPRMLLRMAASRRRDRIRAETPLFINLIILLFEAGLSTRQALTSLVQDGAKTLPEIASELQPVLRQIEAGGDMSALLRDLGKTLAVSDLDSVLAVLRQVERYGGEVREPLSDALATIEEQRGLEIREKVNVMSGKMTVVLVTCFFPALLVFLIGPAFVSIKNAMGALGGGT